MRQESALNCLLQKLNLVIERVAFLWSYVGELPTWQSETRACWKISAFMHPMKFEDSSLMSEECVCVYTHTEGIKCDRPSLLLISNSMALVTTTIHGMILHSCTTTTSYFTPCTITSVFYLKWRVTDTNLYFLPLIPFQIENWPVVITPSMDWPYVNVTLGWDNKK